jgi:hypothetical protein
MPKCALCPYYNRVVDKDIANRRFTLAEARKMLPAVQELTAEAAKDAEALAAVIDDIDEDDPERGVLGAELKLIVDDWAARIREMGLEAKGPWLVDFDNGDGYYCWQHPEPSLSHYHGYEDGFAGRMKIM